MKFGLHYFGLLNVDLSGTQFRDYLDRLDGESVQGGVSFNQVRTTNCILLLSIGPEVQPIFNLFEISSAASFFAFDFESIDDLLAAVALCVVKILFDDIEAVHHANRK